MSGNLFSLFIKLSGSACSAFPARSSTLSNSSQSETRFYLPLSFPRIGNATRLCNANGLWTGQTPQCQPIACGDPVTFPHASVALLNGSTVWKAIAQYACIHGYKEAKGKLLPQLQRHGRTKTASVNTTRSARCSVNVSYTSFAALSLPYKENEVNIVTSGV